MCFVSPMFPFYLLNDKNPHPWETYLGFPWFSYTKKVSRFEITSSLESCYNQGSESGLLHTRLNWFIGILLHEFLFSTGLHRPIPSLAATSTSMRFTWINSISMFPLLTTRFSRGWRSNLSINVIGREFMLI